MGLSIGRNHHKVKRERERKKNQSKLSEKALGNKKKKNNCVAFWLAIAFESKIGRAE